VSGGEGEGQGRNYILWSEFCTVPYG
jgi:hypothetical protein